MARHVVVLKGGMSSERDVSLTTGKAVGAALRELGYRVTEIDMGQDLPDRLADLRPDVVFNALHGTFGEDGSVQGLLECMQIPYTHSGVLASALAMHKPMAKQLFTAVGIECAPGRVVPRGVLAEGDPMPRPFVAKPISNGSSVGVHIVQEGDNMLLLEDGPEDELLLVEEFIPGRELSVAVLDDEALGVIEIRPKAGFYDYTNKYTSGKTEYLIPAPVSEVISGRAASMAVQAHHMLGCRGVSRADIRFDEATDRLVMLEVNTHPGMTPTSLVPKIAAHAGISFPELIERLLKTARCDSVPVEEK